MFWEINVVVLVFFLFIKNSLEIIKFWKVIFFIIKMRDNWSSYINNGWNYFFVIYFNNLEYDVNRIFKVLLLNSNKYDLIYEVKGKIWNLLFLKWKV